MMQNILLIGGGGHCKACIDVIEKQNKFQIFGIIDIPENTGMNVLSYEIIGCDEDLPAVYAKCSNALITVGQIKSPQTRIDLFNKVKNIGYTLPAVISPYAYVSRHAQIDEGTIVMHNALVNAAAKIGKNCIINTNALIEHDAVIEDNCHISTGAIVNGHTIIMKNSFLGSNASTRHGITVPEGSFIKAQTIYTGNN